MTVTNNSDVDKKLAALQLAFKNSLPEKMVYIKQSWEKYFKTEKSDAILIELHIHAHSLAGSGGSFGAMSVSTAARELELELKFLMDDKKTTSLSSTKLDIESQQKLNALISQLEVACDHWQPTNIPYIKQIDNKESHVGEYVYLVDDDELFAQELIIQLEHLDFKIKYFNNVNDFEVACIKEKPIAIIMDMVFSESDVAGANAIMKIIELEETIPPVIFISVRDDIEAKLAAARAGARRYFCKPLDIRKLSRTLEGLTAASEIKPYRILIVDDDESLLQYYSIVLNDVNMVVETLSNPLEILNVISEFKPDLIILDVYMPECSGPELAQVIRQDDNWAMTPIMFLSTESNVNRQLEAMSLGGDDFLVKPIEADHLIAAVSARVKRARWLNRLNTDLSIALRESEYQTVTMNQHDIVCYSDVEGNIVSVNDKFCEISGYSQEELIGQNQKILKSGYHSTFFYKDMWDTITQGNVWHGSICNRKKCGDEYWLNYTIVPFLDAHGKPYKYVSACTDITATRQNEERLNLSQQFANIGTWDWNLTTNEMYWSERIAFIFGYEQEVKESTYEKFLASVHSEDKQSVINAINDCIEYEVEFNLEHRVVWLDGSVHWVSNSGNVVRDEDGTPLHMLGAMQDISSRVEAEIKQRETEERFTFAVEGAGDGVWDWDMRTNVMQFSRLYMEMLGYAENELPDTVDTWVNSVHPDDLSDIQRNLKEYLEGRISIYVVELRLCCKDSSYKWILCRGKVVDRDSEGQPLRMIGIHSDISEQKQAEQNLINAREVADNANRAKSQFLSSMSHELRTPMNAIMGFSQLLKMDTTPALEEFQLDNVNEILNAGTHLMELINDVLDLAKIESGHIELSIETVVVADILAESLQLIGPLADKNNIKINVSKNGDDIAFNQLHQQHLAVRADKTRLKQILLNLLSNAVKYNTENGEITVTCLQVDNGNIRISITDSGAGLTVEQQSQLFNAFNRLGADKTNIEGTGIGLVITKNIVELMDGKIGVESQSGIGSTFWFELPCDSSFVKDEPVLDKNKVKKNNSPSNQITHEYSVLYIEDNPANLRLVTQLLKRNQNIYMWSTHEPFLGIELAEEHKPDLILLDINLPGMDGYEVLKKLRQSEITRSIPVIAISANALPRDIEKGFDAGFDDYITKPIDINVLLHAVEAKLSSKKKS